ncbi:15761_t:CDS:2 [Rhizophagus irregularis]|nr:15761_t:CDS:2 [Rhizophagus irregularis]
MQLSHLLLIFAFTIALANAAPGNYKRDADAEALNYKRDADAQWWDLPMM